MRTSRVVIAVVLVAALAVVAGALASCSRAPRAGGETEATQQPAPSTPPTLPAEEPAGTAEAKPEPESAPPPPAGTAGSGEKMTVNIYLVREEKIAAASRLVPKSVGAARLAMLELLGGPNALETPHGMTTAIPGDTKLLGLKIAGGTATVDLSKQFESGGGTLSMSLRIAQVVHTLTQFSNVKRVTFRLDGKPVESIGGEGLIVTPSVTRADCESVAPAILVEAPTPGDPIKSPVRVRGTANTFEAQFILKIVDPTGKTLVEKPVMATSGTGTRGTFDVTVPYKSSKSGWGKIVVYEASAKDGSAINVVEIPVKMR